MTAPPSRSPRPNVIFTTAHPLRKARVGLRAPAPARPRCEVFHSATTASRHSSQGQPSGPGEFHPRPLTDPDVTVSGHPARATHRRLPPAADPIGLLPSPVGPGGSVEGPTPFAPWALPHLNATTRWSAPRRCIGTFGLAGPPLGPFPFPSPARFSRSARKPRLESCPLYAGRHLASHPAPARLLPGHTLDPGVGVVAVLSTRRRGFAYAHLSSPHLTGAPAFSMTLTTGAF
jgi:hypothetical protein